MSLGLHLTDDGTNSEADRLHGPPFPQRPETYVNHDLR